jgi:hypothetical protein
MEDNVQDTPATEQTAIDQADGATQDPPADAPAADAESTTRQTGEFNG